MLVIYLNTTVNSFQGSYGASLPPQGCASAVDFIITEICLNCTVYVALNGRVMLWLNYVLWASELS
jgi:hypothetical protein